MASHLPRVALILLGVRMASAGLLDWFRLSEPDGHRVKQVHVEVLSPKGIRMWTAYNPDTELFGAELYVKYFGGRTEALECGLCRNTTEPVDGKFMLEDPNLVARYGDVLVYTLLTSDGSTTERHAVKRIFVREELIKPNDPCVCAARGPQALRRSEPASEVDLLERMILRTVANRNRDCEPISNWLVLLAEPRSERADLREYVENYLDQLLLRAGRRMLDAGGTGWVGPRPSQLVVQVDDHPEGIAFQVRTTIDKLKMLDLLSFGGVIEDYDGIF